MNTLDQPKASVSEDLLPFLLPFLFFIGRIGLFLAQLPDGQYGAGDFKVYFELASLKGWPFFSHWVEYPPLFPLINKGIYLAAGGQRYVYDLLLSMLIAFCGSAGLYFFYRIAVRLYGSREGFLRMAAYFGLFAALPYTWWYFEPLVVALVLAGIERALCGGVTGAGLMVGLGILAKWFPGFTLPAVWRMRPKRDALRITATALGVAAGVTFLLWLVSPEMTYASLRAQPGRSSWQTIWALLDGNLTTGAYLLLSDHYNPAIAGIPRGNPSLIPNWITIALAAAAGLWFFYKANRRTDHSFVAFIAITWAVFLLWSPGWSPQWILYLLPLALLIMPLKRAVLFDVALIFLTTVEWPILLQRRLFTGLWIIAPLRIAMLVWLICESYRHIHSSPQEQEA